MDLSVTYEVKIMDKKRQLLRLHSPVLKIGSQREQYKSNKQLDTIPITYHIKFDSGFNKNLFVTHSVEKILRRLHYILF